MKITPDQFEKIKKKAEELYKEIKSIHCPFFNKKVNFNIHGLKHVQKKAWNKPRLFQDQYLRLKFINLAPNIISSSGTLQEFQETKNFERIKCIYPLH